MYRDAYTSSHRPDTSLIVPTHAPILQRKCACGGRTPGTKCSECEARSSLLQRSFLASGESHRIDAHAPPLVGDVLRSNGMPLDAAVRAAMESRFGQDFGNVRVHTGEQAAASASAVDASAYTVGRDIVFGAGQYTPGSSSGQGLLAHELTHVVQQGAMPWNGSPLSIGATDTPHEHEADRASAGSGAATSGALGATVQRQPSGGGPEMPSDAGGTFLRVGENGRIEILARPPAAPGVGNVGAGFRCENGKCTFVAGKDPSDLSNRTYTVQEAIDILNGDKPGTTTPGGKCPPDRVMGKLGLCCPFGMTWDPQQSACVPGAPTIKVCAPAERTPLGTCCPTGEQWNYLNKRCEPGRATGPTFPTLPPLTGGPLKRERPTFRFGTIESATYDDFVTDDAAVPAQHSASLDHLADLLNIYKEVEVHIEGHTDTTADDSHNDKLAKRRAEAVRDALVARKVTDTSRLKVKGFGERQLRVDPERTSTDRAANRRVEVWFHIKPTASPLRP